MGLQYDKIAQNLNVSTSTAYRICARFGEVQPTLNKHRPYLQRLDQRSVVCCGPDLVSEPDPQKIEKEGLAHRPGWKCTLRNVRNFINCRTLQSL